MKVVFKTKRLVLREFDHSDAQSMYDLNIDDEVIKYTGDLPFKSVAEVRLFLQNYSDYKRNGYGRWAVLLKETGEFIGWCGLKLNEENVVDIGFRFFKKFWNQGFATEAANATLVYGFNNLGLSEIVGRAIPENQASIKVLEKLGMKFWKTAYVEGMHEAAYFKVSRKDYLPN